jgi:hypothetical protein
MNIQKPDLLTTVENMLKDRCTNYAVTIEYDDMIYTVYSSTTTAYGMAELLQQECLDKWADNKYSEEEE